MNLLIPLSRIDPNPWNARSYEDPDHIESLAGSIVKDGLQQEPMGRLIVDGKPADPDLYDYGDWQDMLKEAPNARVQLAFGHSRVAAFRKIHDHANFFKADPADYADIPVKLRPLTDEEMFRMGISENVARKQLNPIEEAEAMERYRAEFGKTAGEVGQLFHYTDSGVRGKVRLLKLPPDIRFMVASGDMPEGVARLLIPVYELPESVRLAAEDQDEYIKPSEVIEAAKSGSGYKAINDMMTRLMIHFTEQAPDQPAPQPAPAPVQTPPAPIPAPIPTPVTVRPPTVTVTAPAQITVTRAPEPVPAPAIEAEPESEPESSAPAAPAPAATWESQTIMLSLTYWPDTGHGRMISISGRAGSGLPQMRMVAEADLALPEQLANLLDDLRTQFGG